ncbi:MAG: class I SAM-dependent methyltransferase [Candidatus Riflebacteria bacterium]|nr:class I SAM-dependent methyltransferase [Candidatus Riflebacteria bacterium]
MAPTRLMLTIPEREIARHGPGNILAVCWRQWRTERTLRRRGIDFRTTDPAAVERAYATMTHEEFAAINGRQAWANWRTIPRAMSGSVPDRPLSIIDLGCGTGPSTEVLAFYAPVGSAIIGYELAAPLLRIASDRPYPNKHGSSVQVSFVCQGIAQTLRRPDGGAVPDRSVDLVNASGIVGHHFTPTTMEPLVRELRRILSPQGVAMLDVGPTCPARALISLMVSAGFASVRRCRSCAVDLMGEVVFRRIST